jgi:hypothetical protein
MQHLIDIFYIEGCDNLNLKHWVKALIYDKDISDILQALEITVEEFM